LSQLLAKHGHNSADMEQAGIEYACEQIQGLAAQGVDGIHLYTMNKPAQTKRILQMTGLVDL
jgi:methylenetetrahydrofolate reductase (NADPH)